ncbi:MAG: hypothetical protein LBI84_00690 [Propionibacteriaceae bacterium]|jgi:hypothetical protein|nr:hypothetical protein [Propionibacteriaceae bacterium]
MSDETPISPGQFAELSQGLVFQLHSVPVVSIDGAREEHDTPHGVVVITQTCDAKRDEFIQVAPVAELSEDEARAAARGHTPRFVALPGVSDKAFADLQVISTVRRESLAEKSPVHGCASSSEARGFRLGVARKLGRAAIPDAVAEWLDPLRKLAKTKARRQGDVGWALGQMDQIRIQLDNWESGPFEVHLWFIVDAGSLPSFPEDEMPEAPLKLRNWIGALPPKDAVASIAKRLREGSSDVERYFLWPALGEALVQLCSAAGEASEIVGCSGDVVMVNEFTLEQMKETEEMDLAHLSGS